MKPTATGMSWGDPILMKYNSYLTNGPKGAFINGVSSYGRCYAEFGKHVDLSENFRTCLFDCKILYFLILLKFH